MTETPARGVRGFFLYNPITHKHWFRVYDPVDRRKYRDYEFQIEDLEVEILAHGAALYYDEETRRGSLTWSSGVSSSAAERLGIAGGAGGDSGL